MQFKLFPQSYVLDELFSRQALISQGYVFSKLTNPMLYRGDTRAPEVIFNSGFYRRTQEQKFFPYVITKNRTSEGCVAMTPEITYAIGFADSRAQVLNLPHSWVYLVYAEQGIDLSTTPLPMPEKHNYAKLIQEFTLTGLTAECVLAAIQIQCTANDLEVYYTPNLALNNKKKFAWQILITDFVINPHCSLQETNPILFHQSIAELKKYADKKYFRIPWSPLPEDKDFPITWMMTTIQKDVFLMGYSACDALKIKTPIQFSALLNGFTLEDVTSTWFDAEHAMALMNGMAISEVRRHSALELYALRNDVLLTEISAFTKYYQIDGLALGFSREDILSDWFTRRHVRLIKRGCPMHLLRGLFKSELNDMQEKLSVREVRKLQNQTQLLGRLLGFTLQEVCAEWFSKKHVEAAKNGCQLRFLRNKHLDSQINSTPTHPLSNHGALTHTNICLFGNTAKITPATDASQPDLLRLKYSDR